MILNKNKNIKYKIRCKYLFKVNNKFIELLLQVLRIQHRLLQPVMK